MRGVVRYEPRHGARDLASHEPYQPATLAAPRPWSVDDRPGLLRLAATLRRHHPQLRGYAPHALACEPVVSAEHPTIRQDALSGLLLQLAAPPRRAELLGTWRCL